MTFLSTEENPDGQQLPEAGRVPGQILEAAEGTTRVSNFQPPDSDNELLRAKPWPAGFRHDPSKLPQASPQVVVDPPAWLPSRLLLSWQRWGLEPGFPPPLSVLTQGSHPLPLVPTSRSKLTSSLSPTFQSSGRTSHPLLPLCPLTRPYQLFHAFWSQDLFHTNPSASTVSPETDCRGIFEDPLSAMKPDIKEVCKM